MTLELFDKEQEPIERGGEVLRKGVFADEGALTEYSCLLESYKQLFKTARKLVRLSDQNEAELNSLASSLDAKNRELESLSTRLSKYLAPQVYRSIFTGEHSTSLETRRKKLTVFFSDLCNFTDAAECLQPEDLTTLLNTYFSEMAQIALEHGATIDKFIGDAIVIFFGDPESHGVEEDARACLRMAIAMQRRMQELREKWREEGVEEPFHMRIGINTGYCNVGNFGCAQRMDYTIIGAEVNLAARLEQLADADGILISYETYALVRDMIQAERRPPLEMKGIAREIRPYAVSGILELGNKQRIERRLRGLHVRVDFERLEHGERESVARELELIARSVRDPGVNPGVLASASAPKADQ